jgi:hypothetical protein
VSTWKQFLTRIIHFRFQITGVFLVALGIGASVWLAFAASSTHPPDGAQSALLVLVGAALNSGGVWAFAHRSESVNVVAAHIAVRHLSELGEAIVDARTLAERAFDDGTAPRLRSAVGELSVRLSTIEQRMGSNLEDWSQVHPWLLRADLNAEVTNESLESS